MDGKNNNNVSRAKYFIKISLLAKIIIYFLNSQTQKFAKKMMNNYNKLNNILGWSVFTIASFVYLSTIEQTVSFWDCGEYISTAYKLEVGHPPGAPLFQLFGRIFTLFAATGTSQVAVAINIMSALCSSFTIFADVFSSR